MVRLLLEISLLEFEGRWNRIGFFRFLIFSMPTELTRINQDRSTHSSTCDLELGADSEEEGSGVEGELLADPRVEVVEVDAAGGDSADGRHPRTPVGFGNL